MDYDKDKLRIKFVKAVSDVVDYWNNQSYSVNKSALEGVAFSILCILDGVSCEHPPCSLIPYIDGEDEDSVWKTDVDIAGELHDIFYPIRHGEYDEENSEEINITIFDTSNVPNTGNTCPICGNTSLNYDDCGIDDESYYYKWYCEVCDSYGVEWCDIVFSRHVIEK